MRSVFSHLKHSEDKFYRADSAFCNQECIEEAVRLGAKFTITAHGNTNWEQKVDSITGWIPWQWTEEEQEAFVERKQLPPQIELGSFVYQPGWSDNLRFYIAVKRTWKYDSERQQDRWFYYAVITNWNLFNPDM